MYFILVNHNHDNCSVTVESHALYTPQTTMFKPVETMILMIFKTFAVNA